MAQPASRLWPRLYWALLLLTISWLYWPFLSGEVPAFRDAFHFYYPLEVWLAAQTDAGRFLPHFNPYDGTGTNLIGETSSGLCYPGRILWWIPGLTVAQRFGLVLAVHTSIAAAGAAYAAARMQLSAAAGCLAATAYGLGGAVLFQHVNPVYLIGAAWVPWLLAECWVLAHQADSYLGRETMTVHREPVQAPAAEPILPLRPRMAVWVAAAALMLLGGDPQATANAGIVALLALLTRLVATRSWRSFGRQLVWLTCAVLLVTGLTAAQWMPARHWLAHSQRALMQQSSGLDFPGQSADVPELLRPVAKTIQQPSTENGGSHRKSGGTYEFSIAPWHLLTLLWGTAGGHFLPEHTRVLQLLAAEPRMWTASLSIGLLPALWAIAGWSRRETRTGQRFLIIVAVFSGLAMFGNYAPVWIIRQACHAVGAEQWSRLLPSDEVGSIYWCLTQVVPGYSAFRYPAKWSVWFACALALSSAHAFDRRDAPTRGLAGLCLFVAALSTAAALAIVWLHWMPGGKQAHAAFVNWLASAPADTWLGRPSATAVMRLWLQAAIVAVVISATCALALRLCQHSPRLRTLVVLLTLAELAGAGHMWLVAIDMRSIEASEVAPLTGGLDTEDVSRGRLFERLWAGAGHANVESWNARLAVPTQLQSDRVERLCSYQQVFRLGKLHLLESRQANLSGLMSLTPHSLSVVRHALARADDLRPENRALDEALAWLGVTQRLTAGNQLTWQAVPNARPIVELVAEETGGKVAPTPTCTVERFEGDELRIHVSGSVDGRLVVRLLQDGGWSARLAPQAGRADRQAVLHRVPESTHLGLFQTLRVPAGDWTIQLVYRAPGWWLGLTISLSTLVVWFLLAIGRYANSACPKSDHSRQSVPSTVPNLL